MSRRARQAVLGAAAVVALAVPAAIFGVLEARDGGDEGSSACELQDQPSQGQAHVSDAGAGFQYSTFPPTSGPAASDPVPWNAYDAPLAQSRIVHNLSHGGVAVQYGRGFSSDSVRRVLSWYRTDPDGLVVAPLPELGDRLALTAWTHLALCDRFDQEAFDAFRSAHRFKGPERLSREALQPQEREPERALVEDLSLWPRPFADSLSISLTLSKEAAVTVTVLDEQGRAIRTLQKDVSLAAGLVTVEWDRQDDAGRRQPAGVYIVRVEAVAPDERGSISAAAEAV